MIQEKSKLPGKATPVKVSREQLLAAIRKAVEARGDETISYKKFLVLSKMRPGNVWGNFTKWNDALAAAGYILGRNHRWADNDQLLADWGRVARKQGHAPSVKEYIALGDYNKNTLKRRFGGPWTKVVAAFRSYAMKNSVWADVLALLPKPGQEEKVTSRTTRGRCGTFSERLAKSRAFKEDRQISGDPLYLEGISHAPVNESGVIMLFGAMAAKLGFMVESVRSSFPDCQAKRRIGPDAWLTLRIEFEYESRNFRDHSHPPEGCDMIICWVHNWPDCPQNLQVIALSDELARLRRERMMLAF